MTDVLLIATLLEILYLKIFKAELCSKMLLGPFGLGFVGIRTFTDAIGEITGI